MEEIYLWQHIFSSQTEIDFENLYKLKKTGIILKQNLSTCLHHHLTNLKAYEVPLSVFFKVNQT